MGIGSIRFEIDYDRYYHGNITDQNRQYYEIVTKCDEHDYLGNIFASQIVIDR